MRTKLKLDVETLEVSTFDAGDASGVQGTVHANGADAIPVTRTNCLTTPCCPQTVTCPTGEF
jgi:hypothetical protein